MQAANLVLKKFASFFKKIVAGSVLAILLLVGIFMQVGCSSTSDITTAGVPAYDMSGVTILAPPTFSLVDTWLVMNGAYRIYQLEVTLDLLNSSPEDNYGFITLSLVDASSGTALQYPSNSPLISVPADTEKKTTVTAYFCIEVTGPPPQSISVTAQVNPGLNIFEPTG